MDEHSSQLAVDAVLPPQTTPVEAGMPPLPDTAQPTTPATPDVAQTQGVPAEPALPTYDKTTIESFLQPLPDTQAPTAEASPTATPNQPQATQVETPTEGTMPPAMTTEAPVPTQSLDASLGGIDPTKIAEDVHNIATASQSVSATPTGEPSASVESLISALPETPATEAAAPAEAPTEAPLEVTSLDIPTANTVTPDVVPPVEIPQPAAEASAQTPDPLTPSVPEEIPTTEAPQAELPEATQEIAPEPAPQPEEAKTEEAVGSGESNIISLEDLRRAKEIVAEQTKQIDAAIAALENPDPVVEAGEDVARAVLKQAA